jgi:hypothetical protein
MEKRHRLVSMEQVWSVDHWLVETVLPVHHCSVNVSSTTRHVIDQCTIVAHNVRAILFKNFRPV